MKRVNVGESGRIATKRRTASHATWFAALVFATGFGSGCNREGGTGELEKEKAAVINGTETLALPSVGTLGKLPNLYCSAVLVAPSYVLTAAHCLSPKYTATEPGPSMTFVVQSGGKDNVYRVGRLKSFMTDAQDLIKFPKEVGFNNDLASSG